MKHFGKIGLILILFFSVGQMFGQSPAKKCLTDDLSERLVNSDWTPIPPADSYEKVWHEGEPEFTYLIPVVFHLMQNGGPEQFVTLAQVQSQIDVLNEDFGRYGRGFNNHPDGIDAQIKFCLATIDPNGNSTSGLTFHAYGRTGTHDPFEEGVDEAMKELAVWDPERYMNFYIVRQILGGTTAGYSYFPDEAAGTIYDGVVIDHRQLGRGEGTALFLGRTGSHEAGHYLSLFHPWGLTDTLCGAPFGDGCDDTPEVPVQYYAAAPLCQKPQTCGDSLRQIENYMDYSDDACQNMFTFCQAQRMRSAILNYRSKLVSSDNLTSTGCGNGLDTEATTDEFWVFPNPADDLLMVYADFDDDRPVDIEIVDFAGRRVFFKEGAGMGRGAVPVDVSKFNMGTYHLIIRMENRYQRKSLLIVR